MNKISWKKELYFVRHSISKFKDFSKKISEFFRDFSDFEDIYKNITLIFEVEIYKNALPIFKVKIYINAPLIFFKLEIYINAPPHDLNQRLGFLVVALTSSPHAYLTLTLAVYLSIAIAIYFLIFPSYYIYFHLY